MDGHDRVVLGLVGVCDAIGEKKKTDGVILSILSLEEIIYCLSVLSEGHGVYLGLFLEWFQPYMRKNN